MKLLAVPAFTDNYIWMLHDAAHAVVVDPGDAAPVLAMLDRLKLEIAGILVTHHHGDHTGGLAGLAERARQRGRVPPPVLGPAGSGIAGLTQTVAEGDTVELLGLGFQVLAVPGHTLDHLAYVARPAGEAPLLFCGDTLFSGGCGRLFEGTAAQMHASLGRLAALPADTRVCCAHEYTLSNLAFASAVEPDNAALAAYRQHCEALRARGEPTLPSRIGLERAINPFLRSGEAAVAAQARAQGAASDDPVAVLAAIRTWKNHYR